MVSDHKNAKGFAQLLRKDGGTVATKKDGFSENELVHTMAFSAKSLISLMARGALFLKLTPWTFLITSSSVFRPMPAVQTA